MYGDELEPFDLFLDEAGRMRTGNGIEPSEGVSYQRPSSASWRQPVRPSSLSSCYAHEKEDDDDDEGKKRG